MLFCWSDGSAGRPRCCDAGGPGYRRGRGSDWILATLLLGLRGTGPSGRIKQLRGGGIWRGDGRLLRRRRLRGLLDYLLRRGLGDLSGEKDSKNRRDRPFKKI